MPAFAKLERKVFISQLSIYFLLIFTANLVESRKSSLTTYSRELCPLFILKVGSRCPRINNSNYGQSISKFKAEIYHAFVINRVLSALVSISRLGALKKAKNLDNERPYPAEWIHYLSSPQSRQIAVDIWHV